MLFILLQFFKIAFPELFPLFRIMEKPFSKLVIRSDLLYPKVNSYFIFSKSSGPEPIYKYPESI